MIILYNIQNSFLGRTYNAIFNFLDKYIFSLLLLVFRIWMAQIFWYAGLSKISSWQSTIYLFQYEYMVPYIPVELAAYLATAAELAMPVFLVLGLGTRLAAIPLLIMTAVIQFTYLDLKEHYYWAMILGTLILHGPGKYSLDHLLGKCTKKCMLKYNSVRININKI